MESYKKFIENLDAKLTLYFKQQAKFICCKRGCSDCCEKGDYPLTEVELYYLMQGFAKLNNNTKKLVQENCNKIKKGKSCPFLINKECSVYEYRPIVCRVHGLAYIYKKGVVKLPYCAGEGKNFTEVYNNGEITIEPINENLDTTVILKHINCGEIRNLYDWLK